VVPKIITVLEQQKQQLPLPTQTLVFTKDFLLSYWWLLLLGMIQLGAQGAESLYSSGSKAFQDGLYLMAVRNLRQLAEQYPDHPLADDAEYLRGLAEFYQREYARLIAVFQDFPRRYPQSPFLRQLHFWLGSSYYSLEQYREAAAQLTLQVDKYPGEQEYVDRALLLKGAALEKLEAWRGAG
jgi:TolA-binding protein